MGKTAWVEKTKRRAKFTTRQYNRCKMCGRARGYLRFFHLCRICLRERAAKGQIPGLIKSSW